MKNIKTSQEFSENLMMEKKEFGGIFDSNVVMNIKSFKISFFYRFLLCKNTITNNQK